MQTRTRGTSLEAVRRDNLSTVLSLVHRAGEVSRTTLGSSTGLNRSTVALLVADLVRRGLVDDVSAASTGTPGRPSRGVRARSDRLVVLAADIGVASMTLAVGALGGDLVGTARTDRPADRRTPEATMDDLAELVAEVSATIDDHARVAGLGIAVPGLVRQTDGFVHLAPNLGWTDVHLAEGVGERLGAPLRVAVGNEADLGAWAEHLRGAGVGAADMLYVSGEVGVGGGMIAGGRPLMGAGGYAGEIGHFKVNPGGEECRCGRRGCFETEVGAAALMRRLGRGGGNEREAVDLVLRDAAAGNRDVLAALEDVGRWLGIGLSALSNILNPSRIVLGGFFGRAHPHLGPTIQAHLDREVLGPARSQLSVVPATLGDHSALMGAVELALNPILADPTLIPFQNEADE